MKDTLNTAAMLIAGFVFLLGCGYFFLILPARMSFKALAEANKPIQQPTGSEKPSIYKIDFNEPEEEADPAALRDDPERLPAWTAMRLANRMLSGMEVKDLDEVVSQVETFAELAQAQAKAKDSYGAGQSFNSALQIAPHLPTLDMKRSAFAFIASRLASSARGGDAIIAVKEIDDPQLRANALLDVVSRLAIDGQLNDAKLAATSMPTAIDRAWGLQKIGQIQADRNMLLSGRQTRKEIIAALRGEKDKAKTLESRILVGLALVQAGLGYRDEALGTIDPIAFLPDRVAVLLAIAEYEQKYEKKASASVLQQAERQATQIAEPLHRIDPDLQIARLYLQAGDATKAAEVARRSLASVREVPEGDVEGLRVRALCFDQIGLLFSELSLPQDAQKAWADSRAAAAKMPTPAEQTAVLLDVVEAQAEKAIPAEEIALTVQEIDARLPATAPPEDASWQAEALTRLSRLALKRGDRNEADARLQRGLAVAAVIPSPIDKAARMRPLVALVVVLHDWSAGEERCKSGTVLVRANCLLGAAEGAFEKLDPSTLTIPDATESSGDDPGAEEAAAENAAAEAPAGAQ